MVSVILFLIIIFSGKIFGFPKNKSLDIIKAIAIVFIETIIASILFLGMNLLNTWSAFSSVMLESLNSLFEIILLFAIINGYILYWINRWAFKAFSISKEIQTLCEYIIQWSLIYCTIYQILFDEIIKPFSDKNSFKEVLSLDVVEPSELLFLVLPALISIWISIIAYKHFNDEL
ncbi:hypothetical protein GHK52_10725 [Lactococcus garvieae]|nr:hypothetical protein [Lactococcus garvieae]